MQFVTLAPGTGSAIKASLSKQGAQSPLRIKLCFAGRFDPFLDLAVDTVREVDLVQETEDLTFIIAPETYEIVGNVTISYVDDGDRNGFMLASTGPASA
ncbi:MAG: hypothetical protein PHY29_08410 [Syntrophales bacterium]|nr:hypothetical protein [Syntrophales bacterium]